MPFFFLVRRACLSPRRCKSFMGVGSYQPLAEGKGVRCEAESEGSHRQNPEPRDTNHIRHNQQDEFAKQNEVQ